MEKWRVRAISEGDYSSHEEAEKAAAGLGESGMFNHITIQKVIVQNSFDKLIQKAKATGDWSSIIEAQAQLKAKLGK